MMGEKETREYRIHAKKEQLDILDSLFYTMCFMGIIGASREIHLYVDGDGAFHPEIDKKNSDGKYERISTNLIKRDSKDTVKHGCGYIKREYGDSKDSTFYIYYDFG